MKCMAIWYGDTPIGATKSYYEVKECRGVRAVFWMICRASGCSREMEVVIPMSYLEKLEIDLDCIWIAIHSGKIEPVEGIKRVAEVLKNIVGREMVITILEEEDFVRIEAV